MKRISLETLIHSRQNLSYQEQYEYVCKLLQEEKIRTVSVYLQFIGSRPGKTCEDF